MRTAAARTCSFWIWHDAWTAGSHAVTSTRTTASLDVTVNFAFSITGNLSRSFTEFTFVPFTDESHSGLVLLILFGTIGSIATGYQRVLVITVTFGFVYRIDLVGSLNGTTPFQPLFKVWLAFSKEQLWKFLHARFLQSEIFFQTFLGHDIASYFLLGLLLLWLELAKLQVGGVDFKLLMACRTRVRWCFFCTNTFCLLTISRFCFCRYQGVCIFTCHIINISLKLTVQLPHYYICSDNQKFHQSYLLLCTAHNYSIHPALWFPHYRHIISFNVFK